MQPFPSSNDEPDIHTFAPQGPVRRTSWKRWILIVVVITMVIAGYLYYQYLITPPAEFPANQTFSIAEGSSVAAIAEQLEAERIVRSGELLYMIFLTKYNPSELKAGTYNLDDPINAYAVAELVTQGDFTADLERVTHREGESVVKLATRLDDILINFDSTKFIEQATPLEGMIYPDTYLVPPTITETELITIMQNRYQSATAEVREQIELHPLSEPEIIKLASIIEREANSTTSMKLVSGILQNRLEIGMPLQVDASMEYILDKPLVELVPSDLQQESPYNTYLNTGLPPTPIGNPGLASITAVLEPTDSDYFYYITGNDGEFYYARTFDAHRQNIARYLR